MYTQEPSSLMCPLDLPSISHVSRGSPGSAETEAGDHALFPALCEPLVRTKAPAFPSRICFEGTMCFSSIWFVCCEQDNRNLKEQNDELNGQIINLSIQGAKNLFSASFSESLAAEISSVSRDEVCTTGYCLPQTASSQGGWYISSPLSQPRAWEELMWPCLCVLDLCGRA